jgi:hypothetical protein
MGEEQKKESKTYANLVLLRDTLSDADNQRNLRLDSLNDGIGSEGRGNVDDSRLRLDLVGSLFFVRTASSVRSSSACRGRNRAHLTDGTPDGKTKVLSAGLLRGDTTEKLGTKSEGLFAVESSLCDAIESVRMCRETEGIAGKEGREKERTVLPL